MTNEYIKFIIAYDYCKELEDLDLACDEAFELAEEICKLYKEHILLNNLENYYDILLKFLEEISFEEIWTKLENKNIKEEKEDNVMKNIIKPMVKKGYELGYIYLINNPNNNEIAAQIGGNWFYFDPTEDRFMSVEEYEANVLFIDIVELIYSALTEMKTEFEDEYLYYFAYLFENLEDYMILTWYDLRNEFPEDRCHMTEDREREFVYHCFNLYEMEGFNDVYWTPYDEEENFIGQKFKSISRCPESRNALEMQPLWDVEFENGKQYTVYPEEIIPSKMKAHGCPDEYLKLN